MPKTPPDAAELDLESPKEDTPYYAALGRFVTAYADVESGVHIYARKLSGLSDAKARVMFSGLRLSDLQNKVRALLALSEKNEAAKKEVEVCFTQLDLIALKRDKLVHRQVRFRSDHFSVSNIFTVKSLASYEEEIIDLIDMQAMEFDCHIIYGRIARLRSPALRKRDSELVREVMSGPWFYKPLRLERPPKPPKPSRRARRLLRESSQG